MTIQQINKRIKKLENKLKEIEDIKNTIFELKVLKIMIGIKPYDKTS